MRAVIARIEAGKRPLPDVGAGAVAGRVVAQRVGVPPGIARAIDSAAGGIFPFGFGWQVTAAPMCIGLCIGMADMDDRQVCQIDETGYVIRNQDLDAVDVPVHDIAHFLGAGDADRGDYPHYMLKEIYEQPETLANAMRGRLVAGDGTAHFGGLNLTAQQLRQVDRVIMTACGTSYHAALVGEYLFEELARIPVEVEYASEFRYRYPPVDRSTVARERVRYWLAAAPERPPREMRKGMADTV